jgi:DNA invertase Pin-like site-specific DNA recombinase
METPIAGPIAPPSRPDWQELARRVGDIHQLSATDPLMALAQMTQVLEDAGALGTHEMERLVRLAREDGKDWGEIAAVTGLKEEAILEYLVRLARQDGKTWEEIAEETGVSRQAAWRRWNNARGID